MKGICGFWKSVQSKATAAILTFKTFFSSGAVQICQRLTYINTILTQHQSKIFWGLAVLYKIAEDALYVWGTSAYYSYEGMVYAPSAWKYLFSWILFLIMFAYTPKEEEHVGSFLLHLQLAYTVCPLLTYFAFANGSVAYIAMVFACIMLENWLVRGANRTVRPPYVKGVQNYTTVGLGVLLIFTLAIPVLQNGFAGLRVFDFQYIYEMRANATYPPGFTYIFSWFGKAILPFAMLYALYRKKYCWAVVAAFSEVLLYMESGYKFYLLIIVPILAVYILAKSRHLIKLMYGGLSLLYLMIIPLAHMDFSQGHTLGMLSLSFVGERALHGSAVNKFLYYNFFRDFPKIFFSDGQIGKMLGLTYPYAGGSGQIIYAYGRGEFLASNSITGYLGESYAQMGFLGMILMSLLFGGILRGLSSYREKELFPILAGLFALYVIVLNDAPLFTTLVYGGMLISYLLVFIYLSRRSGGKEHGIQRF